MPVEESIKRLRDAIISCDKELALEATREIIDKGIDPIEAFEKGLVEGARVVGDKFDRLEIFLTELIQVADVMKACTDLLMSQIPKGRVPKKGTVVIGTVKGDIHEIGKNIVASLLSANGFDVHDLGADVPAEKFIEEADKVGADIMAVSALMTSTIGGQKDVIDYLKAAGKRKKFYVMVGGGPTTREWAEQIGADGYAETAMEAVKVALDLIQKRRSS